MRIYWLELKCELLTLLRMPRFTVSVIGIPMVFFLFYGVMMKPQQTGVINATYMMATFGAFGVMAAAVWGITAGIANDRGSGWMQVKRASPMPPMAYFVAKLAGGLFFAALSTAVLFFLGTCFAGVRLTGLTWLLLGATMLLGAIPFCALGFVLGYVAKPASAPALINLLIMPMAFFSGLWLPLMFLPPAVRQLASYLPPYHLMQLGLRVLSLSSESTLGHWTALGSLTLIFAGVGALLWRKEENKVYG